MSSEEATARQRSFRGFTACVLLGTCAIVGAIAAANFALDLYGLYGDVRGRKLVPYESERRFKYMFSYNYIPANFDGLLVGSSITDNWETERLSGQRIYNASISGANIGDVAPIATNFLERGKPKTMIFVVNPYLTLKYTEGAYEEMKQDYWGALGSIQLFKQYLVKLRIDRGMQRQEFSPFGAYDYPAPKRQPTSVAAMVAPAQVPDFEVDPRALRSYRGLIEKSRAAGASIVAIVPPVSPLMMQTRGPAIKRYIERMRGLFQPEDAFLDLNDGDLVPLRNDPQNFPDGAHLSSAAARRVVDSLRTRMLEHRAR